MEIFETEVNGYTLKISKASRDFTVIVPVGDKLSLDPNLVDRLAPLSNIQQRVTVRDDAALEELMAEARTQYVAHHIYDVAETGEELILTDTILLRLVDGQDDHLIDEIAGSSGLELIRPVGRAYLLRVSDQAGMNPLKVCNMLRGRSAVADCTVVPAVTLYPTGGPEVAGSTWHLQTLQAGSQIISADAGCCAVDAWTITTGDPDIVVAVIDDGFDLNHSAFSGTALHPDAFNFVDRDTDVAPREADFHGTSVASLIFGSHLTAVQGMAPNCTFLPLRIALRSAGSPVDLLEVLEYASERADVVNCSFGMPPSSFDMLHRDFRERVSELTQIGGRSGKGLVIVFSSGNDDAPTFLTGADNLNGVSFVGRDTQGKPTLKRIPDGMSVFSGHPMTLGVVVAAAASSMKRKAGYSCWGEHVTVAAPSSNGHFIPERISAGTDPLREAFVAAFNGAGVVAARKGVVDDPSPLTHTFGGTSAAAAIVSGAAALVLATDPSLSGAQVVRILQVTADAASCDQSLDLASDPNLQGLAGAFTGGHSRFFGAGKINAVAAVEMAAS